MDSDRWIPSFGKQGRIGLAAMLVGTLLFIPSLFVLSGLLGNVGLFVGAALLVLGTYLVGIEGDGPPV